MKILYVEDDINAREQFAELLQLSGQEILVAKDGQEGKELFDRHHPYVVITDINMPKCNGIELTKYIKEKDEQVFIVITTAYNDYHYLVDAIEAGVDKFLLKPLSYEKISELLTCYVPFVEHRIKKIKEQKNISNILEVLWESKIAGLCLTDEEGNILKINQLLQNRLYEQDLLGKKIGDFLEEMPTELCALINRHDDEFVNCFYLRYQSQKTPVLIKEESFKLEDDEYITLFRIHEVSKELEFAQEAQKQEAMLIQQSKMASLGEMLQNIAHQWRQPLNALSINIGNFVTNCENQECSKLSIEVFEQKCNEQIRYMSQTIDDFKNFFKPDKQVVAFSPYETVKKLLDLVDTTYKASNIAISFTEDESIKKIKALGYPNEYKQAILNLLSNAKDAIESSTKKKGEGKIVIRLSINEPHIKLEVADNGGGIPEDILEDIFMPYFSTKGGERGTGIGLYMSKTIVEKHMHGLLRVENNEEGAVFCIALPLVKE